MAIKESRRAPSLVRSSRHRTLLRGPADLELDRARPCVWPCRVQLIADPDACGFADPIPKIGIRFCSRHRADARERAPAIARERVVGPVHDIVRIVAPVQPADAE